MQFTINTVDKPYLEKAMREESALAKEVISVLALLMNEAFDPSKGIRWADLPKELHKDLDFGSLVRGVLRGSMDLKDISPDAFDALKVEVHPLAMLQPRKNYLEGGMRYHNWRNHFKLDEGTPVSEETVSNIFRKMLQHIRFVKIDQLRQALESHQIAAHRGLGDVQIEKLPFVPALRYQKKQFDDLHVGKFLEQYGLFDCGSIGFDETKCLACASDDLKLLGNHMGCMSCNAGYVRVDR